MPYGIAAEREVAYQNESTFGTIADPTWASRTVFLCVDPNFEGMQQSTIDNLNYRQRALATRAKVQSLANGEFSFGMYLHGRLTAVADDARATITSPNFPLAHMLQNAWGGIRLGYRTVLSGGTAAEPDVEAGDGTQYAAGDWGFFIDGSSTSGPGYFRKIESIDTDTLTLWAGHDLPFTPANGDIIGSVIQAYPVAAIMGNQNHASHLTQSFLAFGDLSDDAQQGSGCKLNLSAIEGLAPGEAGMLRFDGMATRIVNEGITQPSAGTPIGDAPVVTATGDDTVVYISAVGSALASVEAQSFAVNPGVASQPIPCVGGIEGRSGYTLSASSADETTVEVNVDYDDAWNTGFANETRYQVLIQVGNIPGRAFGLFFANCELMEDPSRGSATDLTVSVLKFRCLESGVSTSATGDDLEKMRAKCEILFSTALA